jgi:cleavage stimulation factor subunit 3
VWIRYAEAELAAGNAAGVRDVFARCLLTCRNVELWFVYIRFIKKVGDGGLGGLLGGCGVDLGFGG